MKHILRFSTVWMLSLLAVSSFAQTRYLEEVFTDSEIMVQKDVAYGVNVDVLKNQQLLDPQYVGANAAQIQMEHNEIRDSILSGGPASIPTTYFQPVSVDPNTIVKLTDPVSPFNMLKMDVYMPNPGVDTESQRPVMVYVHTGNFLPKAINGGVTGSKDDSAAVELCRQWAKRGFVVLAPNYRLGWNPNPGTTQFTKTYTLLNAVYRAILDVKQAVRVARSQAASFGIDPTKVALYGQGSGGYVALAYNSLDDWQQTTLTKFSLGQPVNVIDTTVVGNIEGQGGLLNFYTYQGAGQPGDNGNSSIQACVNAGGALADISWITGEEAPFITVHAIRDQFAPFDTGTVIVPTTNEEVVDVNGPNTFMPKVNSLGINDAFIDLPVQRQDGSFDEVTIRARSLYGRSFTDIPLININEPITLSTEAEGLFALQLPEGEGSPWEWWNETEFEAYYDALVAGGITINFTKQQILASASATNPNQKSNSLIYIDTIQQYIMPRVMRAMEIGDWEALSTEEVTLIDSETAVYPNPTTGEVFITSTGEAIRSIEVMDITGKVVRDQDVVSPFNNAISLAHAPSGIYFVRVHYDAATVTRKLIKR